MNLKQETIGCLSAVGLYGVSFVDLNSLLETIALTGSIIVALLTIISNKYVQLAYRAVYKRFGGSK